MKKICLHKEVLNNKIKPEVLIHPTSNYSGLPVCYDLNPMIAQTREHSYMFSYQIFWL